MAIDLDELKGVISAKGGVAKGNVFKVQLPTIDGVNLTANQLNLLCINANLPGRQILTYDKVIGLQRQKVAYGFASDDVNMSFLLLNDYGVKDYFEVWQSKAVDTANYQIAYKSDYTYDVTISQLKKGISFPIFNQPLNLPDLPSDIKALLPEIGPIDLSDGEIDLDLITNPNVIYTCKLLSAFPTTMNTVQLGNDQNDLIRLDVQLSYTNWQSE